MEENNDSSAISSHNSRDVILSHNSRNTTCLTPIPSHNSRDTFRATTQGTLANPPLKHHQTSCRSQLHNQIPSWSSTNRLAGDTCRHALPAPRPPGRCRVPPGAQRLKTCRLNSHRLAGQPPPPGANATESTVALTTAWRNASHRQAHPARQLPCSAAIAWRIGPHRQVPYQNPARY